MDAHMPQRTCGGQSEVWERQFSLSTTLDPEIDLGPSGLVVGAFAHEAIILAFLQMFINSIFNQL